MNLYEDYTVQILDNLGIYWDDIAYRGRNCTILYGDLINILLTNRASDGSAVELGTSTRTLERITVKAFHDNLGLSKASAPWRFKLLALIDIKECYKCGKLKNISTEYYKHNTGSIFKKCKECDLDETKKYYESHKEERNAYSKLHYTLNKAKYLARNAKRRAIEVRAIPLWADLELIERFYENRPEGYHVDHIVPLQGDNVCGLHVINNLQYLTAADNLSKKNKWIS